MLYNFFGGKSGNSRFPLKPLVQYYDMLKEINSYWVKFCLKIAFFHIFVQVQILEQTIFQFLILGKSRFPPKKFYNVNYWVRNPQLSETLKRAVKRIKQICLGHKTVLENNNTFLNNHYLLKNRKNKSSPFDTG